MTLFATWYDLYNLKSCGNYAWRIVTFSKVITFRVLLLLIVTLLQGCFSRFLDCTDYTKPRKASHLTNKNEKKITSTFCKKAFLKNDREQHIKKHNARDLIQIKTYFYYVETVCFNFATLTLPILN